MDNNIIQFKKPRLVRGIVAPAGIMSISGKSLHIERTYLNEDIFYYVMYWDKIAIPTSSAFHCGVPLERELTSLGLLERPRLPIVGKVDIAQHTHWTFGEIAKIKLKEEKTDWMVHHMSGDPIYLPEHSTKQDCIRLKITKALPVPSGDGKFSLDDLLDFKYRRSSELEGLHISMDRLLRKIHYEEVSVIQKTELMRFEKAITELDKTIFERFKIYKKSDFEVNVDLKGDALLALALNSPAIGSSMLTGEIPFAALATSVFSFFSL